jgi:hypothetical protein
MNPVPWFLVLVMHASSVVLPYNSKEGCEEARLQFEQKWKEGSPGYPDPFPVCIIGDGRATHYSGRREGR